MRLTDDDDHLDRDFPLGDGTAETGATVHCPCCGQAVDITVDPAGGAEQEYVEDCQICCRPWRLSVRYHGDGRATVSVSGLDA